MIRTHVRTYVRTVYSKVYVRTYVRMCTCVCTYTYVHYSAHSGCTDLPRSLYGPSAVHPQAGALVAQLTDHRCSHLYNNAQVSN